MNGFNPRTGRRSLRYSLFWEVISAAFIPRGQKKPEKLSEKEL